MKDDQMQVFDQNKNLNDENHEKDHPFPNNEKSSAIFQLGVVPRMLSFLSFFL